MVTRSPMVAKAMSPIDPHGTKHPAGGGMPAFNPTMGMMTKPPHKPAPGSSPSASQYDGPYGGKKPQS